MITIPVLLAAESTKDALEQAAAATERAQAMQIALITIAALAAANLLLVILIVARRKKEAK